MWATFVNFERGIIGNIDFSNGFKERILNWLATEHSDVWRELDFHNGGTIGMTGDEIQISGDNGLLILEMITIKEI